MKIKTYIEFGRIILAGVWQPRINMSFGSAWGYDDATEVELTEGRDAEFFNVGPRRRTFSADLDNLEAEEAFNELSRMRRILGVSGEVLVTDQIIDTPQSHQKTMLARFTELDPVRHPYALNWRSSINLREIL